MLIKTYDLCSCSHMQTNFMLMYGYHFYELEKTSCAIIFYHQQDNG